MEKMKISVRLGKRKLMLAGLLAGLVLGGCATVPTGKPEDVVAERAGARWKHLLAKEFDKAYAFIVPGYRAVVTADAYRGRIGSAVKWVDADVYAVECPEPQKCIAKIKLTFVPALNQAGGGTFSTHFDETWLQENGNWWIFQDVKSN